MEAGITGGEYGGVNFKYYPYGSDDGYDCCVSCFTDPTCGAVVRWDSARTCIGVVYGSQGCNGALGVGILVAGGPPLDALAFNSGCGQWNIHY
jgi:hypothetical protein